MLNPKFDTNRILTWCEAHRAELPAQVIVLEGMEQRPAKMLTTVKRHLAELDELPADMRPARTQSQVSEPRSR
jgi:hypothetical protein